jgi:hypothetical protein
MKNVPVTSPCPDISTMSLINVNMTVQKYRSTRRKYVTPVYGEKTQYATRDETPLLSANQCTTIE